MHSRMFNKCPLVLVAVCLMAGIVVASYVLLPIPVLPIFVAMVAIACLLHKYGRVQSAMILVCCLLLGMLLMQRHLSQPSGMWGEERLERCRVFFLQERSHLLKHLSDAGLDGEAYAVVAAMSLGDKSALTHEVKNAYAVSGASHVLALSGLHMGIIYMLLSFFLPRRRWPAVSQLLLLLAMWTFVFLVGLPVSAIRAAVMLSVYALLSLGHRDRMSVNTLAFAAIMILMWRPDTLFDISFQLSFMAVWSILVFVPLLERLVPAEYLMSHRCVKWLWGLVTVSCAAQLGVAPLVAYYFGCFPTYFLLTNFVVIPTAFVILLLALLSWVSSSFIHLLLLIVQGLNAVLFWIASLPGASIDGLHPSVLQVVLVYVLMLCGYLLIERIIPIVVWKPSK